MMINWDDFDEAKYLNTDNLPGKRLVLTISRVADEEIGTPPKRKPVVYGQQDGRGLVLNKTRRTVLRAGLGDNTDKWVGRRILITVGPALFQGRAASTLVVQVLPQSRPAPRPAPAPVEIAEENEIPAPDNEDWETIDLE